MYNLPEEENTMIRFIFQVFLLLATFISCTVVRAGDSGPMQLTVYYGAMRSQMEPVLDAFKKQYPNITIKEHRAATEELMATMEMELRARNPQFDVAVAQNAGFLNLQNDYGLFDAYAPSSRSAIMEGLLDPENIQTPIGTGFYVILYNSKLVSKEEAPKSWADLIDAKWTNKITLADPKSSSSVYSFIWYITQHLKGEPYGWSYFEQLQKLKPAYAPSHGNIGEVVALGERSIGVQVMATVRSSMAKGDPVSWVFPADGIPSELTVSVIRKNTPSRRAAELFTEFLLSKEGQQLVADHLGYIPVRKDLDFSFANGAKLSDITLIKRDVDWIANNKEDVIERFRIITSGK